MGFRIQPAEEKATENLGRYVIRDSFLQEKVTYLLKEFRVIYGFKDDKEEKMFDALDRLAAMTSYVPNRGNKRSAIMATIAMYKSDSQVPFFSLPFIRDAPPTLMRDLGYGEGYKYPYDYVGLLFEEETLPRNLDGKIYYQPSKQRF